MTKRGAENDGVCPACGQKEGVSRRGRLVPHHYNGDSCSGTTGRCKGCDNLQALSNSGGRVIKHFLEDGEKCVGSNRNPQKEPPEIRKGEVECPVCRRRVLRADNGTVLGHNGKGRNVWCPGSGVKVATPTPSARRPDDRKKSSSVRTISSGLGSLGKR